VRRKGQDRYDAIALSSGGHHFSVPACSIVRVPNVDCHFERSCLVSVCCPNISQIFDSSTHSSALSTPSSGPLPDLWSESSQNDRLPPPSYDDTIADLPPDYTTTDAPASVQLPEYSPWSSLDASLCSDVPNCLRLSCNTSPDSSLYLDEKSSYADIDFGFTEDGVKSHAKKKKGAAAKKTTAFDDGEEKKDEAAGDAGGDNGGGGGDPPADGGAGGAGDGGDDKKDDDDWGSWDTGKKKKGKKSKKEEEEEERKRKEEEEEAERKKKEEEDAAAAATGAGADLSWADQADDAKPDDDWGTFATVGKTTKKKGKKGKVRNFGCLITRCNALTSR
jgi:hypothetical protein